MIIWLNAKASMSPRYLNVPFRRYVYQILSYVYFIVVPYLLCIMVL